MYVCHRSQSKGHITCLYVRESYGKMCEYTNSPIQYRSLIAKQKLMSRLIKVEDYFRKIVRSRLSQGGQTIYDYFGWFVRMRWFDYLGMGFLLLRIDATLTYWTGVYFAGHLSLVVMGLLGVVIVNPVMKMVTTKKRD